MQKVLAVLLATCCVGAAQAAEAPRGLPPAYAGVGVAGVDYVGAATRASPKVFAGYQFGKRLAAEGGALDLKDGYGMYIAVKPSLPLTDRLSAYGKLGVAQTRHPALPSATAATATLARRSRTGAYGAFGLQYSITPNAAVAIEVERLPLEKPSALKPNVWTLALQFLF